jgi:PAS domain S-box-containing protein
MGAPVRRLGGADLTFLEQIFDSAGAVGFFVKDRDLRYIAASREMARFCGVERPSDVYGKGLRDFFPPDIAERYEALDRWVLATGHSSTHHFDLTISGKGEPVWAMFSRIPVKDAAGATVGVAAVAHRVIYAGSDHPLYRRIAAVARYVRAAPEEPLDLDALAAIAEVSKSQLQRDFRKLFGKTLRGFQHQIRIERAVQLLSQGLPVVEVAYACGYADHSAFTRRFRAETGMSPSGYRAG